MIKNRAKQTIIILLTLIIGVFIGAYTQQPTKAEQTQTTTENKGRGERLTVTNTYTKDNGGTVTEYNNGSWSLYNDTTKEYYFQSVEFGDYVYIMNNKKDLENLIQTYTSIYETGFY